MLQLFISFPEFSEFSEFLFHLGKTLLLKIAACRNSFPLSPADMLNEILHRKLVPFCELPFETNLDATFLKLVQPSNGFDRINIKIIEKLT